MLNGSFGKMGTSQARVLRFATLFGDWQHLGPTSQRFFSDSWDSSSAQLLRIIAENTNESDPSRLSLSKEVRTSLTQVRRVI